MKHQYWKVDGNPDIIIRGDEDEDGNVYECYIQANLDVHNLSEQEALALVGTV